MLRSILMNFLKTPLKELNGKICYEVIENFSHYLSVTELLTIEQDVIQGVEDDPSGIVQVSTLTGEEMLTER
jgi:hypothetical protein